MINHIRYAISKYSFWLSIFATIIGIVAIVPICECIAVITVILCFALPFIIPFIASYRKQVFAIKTIGKSKVSFKFGDLFNEECIVITTNRYYDINPTGEYVSDNSVLGIFVQKFCNNSIVELEESLKAQLRRDEDNNLIPAQYGEYIKKEISGKMIYFLVFTDRNKSDQPQDFYTKAVQGFFNRIVNENHGKTICIPILGGNNNLSDSGFSNVGIAFRSLLAMISSFEIVNQRSELKLEIVALPKQRSELIDVVSSYAK
ncbi:MAG: hypothetical protein HDR21_04650 [Lachnospiraceae bacterium]|nr:hypothetical protein [Lachnospiraceae bacterium]